MTTTESVRARTNPSIETAHSVVETGLDSDALVTIFGECTVDYEGRAESTLGPGERHVMLKPDGAALVHTDEGQQPVNWQPPDCDHEVSVVDGQLLVESHRETPAEHLAVTFESVLQASAFGLTDERDLSLAGTEEDLRERILDDPALVESGFVPSATERETTAGPVDVFGEDDAGRPVVVELKRRRVGPAAASQLRRYVEAVDEEFPDEGVRGLLVAPSVTDRAAALLDELDLEFVPVEPPASAAPE